MQTAEAKLVSALGVETRNYRSKYLHTRLRNDSVYSMPPVEPRHEHAQPLVLVIRQNAEQPNENDWTVLLDSQSGASVLHRQFRFNQTFDDIARMAGHVILAIDASLPEEHRAMVVGAGFALGIPIVALGWAPSKEFAGSTRPILSLTEDMSLQASRATLDRAADQLGKDTRLRLFEDFDSGEPSYIVCAEIPPELRPSYAHNTSSDYLRLATFADVDAMVELRLAFAAATGRRLTAHTHDSMPDEIFRANMIVVGGPAWNSLALRLQEQLHVPFSFLDGGPGNPDAIKDINTGREYSPTITRGEVIEDIGLFVRAPSPFASGRTVIMCSGTLTHGVEGSAMLFTDDRVRMFNQEYVEDHFGENPYFALIFRVAVVHNNNIPPRLGRGSNIIQSYVWTEEHGFIEH